MKQESLDLSQPRLSHVAPGNENVITLTTDKAVGEKIKLAIKAEGSLTIEGATGTFVNCEGAEYTLTAQTVNLRGTVSGLNCPDNLLTALDLSGNHALTELDCSANLLTALNVSENPALATLNCSFNRLTALNVSENPALATLFCSFNPLAALDLSENPALTWLDCSQNGLAALDLSENPALTWLDCSQNGLTALDLSENFALTALDCTGNRIKGDAMTALVNSLPQVKYGEESDSEYADFSVIDREDPDEGNVCTEEQAAVAVAKAKGRRVRN